MTNHQERAIAAALAECEAWDIPIQPAVMKKIATNIRNAALEEAAALCDAKLGKLVDGELPFGVAKGLAVEIRALSTKEPEDGKA